MTESARGERNFEGHEPRRCGEHRTVGSHRAWCYSCAEWCYPSDGCVGCKPDVDDLMEEIERLRADRDRLSEGLRVMAARLTRERRRAREWEGQLGERFMSGFRNGSARARHEFTIAEDLDPIIIGRLRKITRERNEAIAEIETLRRQAADDLSRAGQEMGLDEGTANVP